MMINNVYDHEAVIHGFVRKALRYAGDEADFDEREEFEQDAPEYAETIERGGGYDLDKRIAALTAERDALREALRPFADLWRDSLADKPDDTPIYGFNDVVITVGQIREARAVTLQLKPITN